VPKPLRPETRILLGQSVERDAGPAAQRTDCATPTFSFLRRKLPHRRSRGRDEGLGAVVDEVRGTV